MKLYEAEINLLVIVNTAVGRTWGLCKIVSTEPHPNGVIIIEEVDKPKLVRHYVNLGRVRIAPMVTIVKRLASKTARHPKGGVT